MLSRSTVGAAYRHFLIYFLLQAAQDICLSSGSIQISQPAVLNAGCLSLTCIPDESTYLLCAGNTAGSNGSVGSGSISFSFPVSSYSFAASLTGAAYTEQSVVTLHC